MNIVAAVVFPMLLFLHLGALLGIVGYALDVFIFLAYAMVLKAMLEDLRAITKGAVPPWWHMAIPFYDWYLAFSVIPAEMAKAKQMAGVAQPTRVVPLLALLPLGARLRSQRDRRQALTGALPHAGPARFVERAFVVFGYLRSGVRLGICGRPKRPCGAPSASGDARRRRV